MQGQEINENNSDENESSNDSSAVPEAKDMKTEEETAIIDARNHPKAKSIEAIDYKSVHRICSGQVVLTLATAVKELVENSIDAGATNIEIKLKEYGSEIVEVTDNGSGVSEENFEGLTLKHHTSKLKEFSDLSVVETFGFRGEALSSLCALSHLSIVTRHKEANVATKLEYDHNGKITSKSPCARQQGTTISLQNLFYTLPVRHKEFHRNLKKEFCKMVNVLNAYCVINVNVRLTCHNQTGKGSKNLVVSSLGNSSMKQNIGNIFGVKQLHNLIEFVQIKPNEEISEEFGIKLTENEINLFKLEGFVSKCEHNLGRSTTDRQFFFVNKRPCDSAKMSKVVNDVYHMYNRHQYPFVVLHASIAKQSVDVNVTPDKRQIFVENEKLLLATIKASLITMYEPTSSLYKVNQLNPVNCFDSSLSEAQLSKTPAQSKWKDANPNQNKVVSSSVSKLSQLKRSFSRAFSQDDPDDPDNATPSSRLSKFSSDKQRRFSSPLKPKSRFSSPEGILKWVTPNKEMKTKSEKNNDRNSSNRSPSSLSEESSYSNAHCSKGESPPEKTNSVPWTSTSDTPNPHFPHAQSSSSQADSTVLISTPDSLDSHFPHGQSSSTVADSTVLISTPDSLDSHFPHGQSSSTQANQALFISTSDIQLSKQGCENNSERPEDDSIRPISKNLLENGTVAASTTEDGSTSLILIPFSVSSEEKSGDTVKDPDETLNQPTLALSQKEIIGEQSDFEKEKEIVNNESKSQKSSTLIHLELDEKPKSCRKERMLHFSLDSLRCRIDRLKSCKSRKSNDGFCRSFRAKISPIENESAEEELKKNIEKSSFEQMEILGQFNLGFIVTRLNDDLFIIDQHATDEKYNFETLRRDTIMQGQKLICPQNLELTASNEIILMDNLEIFKKNGFDFVVDELSAPGQRVKLLTTPVSKNWNFGKDDIEELIFMLKDSPGVMCRPSRIRQMFASRACRKSVMIGTALNQREMKKLVNHMSELDQPWNCPHGRPTMRHLINLNMLPTS